MTLETEGWLPFVEARNRIRLLKISSSREFLRLHREGKIPKGIPAYQQIVYKNKEWVSWPDFLGNVPRPETLLFEPLKKTLFF